MFYCRSMHSYAHTHYRTIYESLTTGFIIGFESQRSSLQSRNSNYPSALANTVIVREKIAAKAGRLHGLLPAALAPGLVPKNHQINKWCLIVDLSSRTGSSINDGIDPSLCSLLTMQLAYWMGTEMVKLDIKDAYRIVPVHPADYHLLGIQWEGRIYTDRALPFSLRSAPTIFSAAADFVAWLLNRQGVCHLLHYLAPGSPGITRRGSNSVRNLQNANIPVASNKTEVPATLLGFLGVLMDSTVRPEGPATSRILYEISKSCKISGHE